MTEDEMVGWHHQLEHMSLGKLQKLVMDGCQGTFHRRMPTCCFSQILCALSVPGNRNERNGTLLPGLRS